MSLPANRSETMQDHLYKFASSSTTRAEFRRLALRRMRLSSFDSEETCYEIRRQTAFVTTNDFRAYFPGAIRAPSPWAEGASRLGLAHEPAQGRLQPLVQPDHHQPMESLEDSLWRGKAMRLCRRRSGLHVETTGVDT